MEYKNTLIISRIRRFAKESKKVLSNFIKTFWLPSFALLAVAVFWFIAANGIPVPTDQTIEKYAVYGDSFGRITSLFTALGFGGLVITLLMQQRQIRAQEEDAKRVRQNDEKGRYEEILFRLLDIYQKTLTEVRSGEKDGRDVLLSSLNRVHTAIVAEEVNCFPTDIKSRFDNGSLTESDKKRIDYLHFRNFKIISAELHPQTRLIDTFEVLLDHMLCGAPQHLLIDAYRDLVFAQITYLECRYFFLVALSQPNRSRLRELLVKTEFFDQIPRSEIHKIHREMYSEYWCHSLEKRNLPASLPMSKKRVINALRAHKSAGGIPRVTYTSSGARQTKNNKGYMQ